MGVKHKLVYNNIYDLNFGNNDFLFFPDDKQYIAQAFIPPNIRNGSRNQTLSAIAYQIRALNPEQSEDEFKRFLLNINSSRCKDPLGEKEVLQIAFKTLNSLILEPILNKPRRIIFNPKSELNKQEKRTITNQHLGMMKSEKTKLELKNCLLNWDIEKLGRITQKKLAEVANKNIKTIEKYYKCFISMIYDINGPS